VAYRQVSAERERFLALVEAMPAGLAVVEDGVVTAWNATAELLTGRTAAEVIGAPPPIDLDHATEGVELGSRWIEAMLIRGFERFSPELGITIGAGMEVGRK